MRYDQLESNQAQMDRLLHYSSVNLFDTFQEGWVPCWATIENQDYLIL